VRDRHSAHYCAALERWDVEMQGPRQAVAQEEIEADLENVRAAWEWAAARGDIARLDQALDGLWRFFWLRTRFHDDIAACQVAIDAAGQVGEMACDYADAQRVIARATIRQAYAHYVLGQGTLARSLLDRAAGVLDGPALAGHDTRAERALLLVQMGYFGGLDKEQARRALDQSLSLFRAVGDRHEEAWCLTFIALEQRDVNAAISILEEALALFQARGEYLGMGYCHVALGALSSYLGEYDRAIRHYRDSLAPFRAGRIVHESLALCRMADTHRLRGDYDAARQLYHEGLSIARSLGLVINELVALFGLGALAMDTYDAQGAGRRFQTALAFAQEHQQWFVARALAAIGDLSSFQGQFDVGADYVRQSVTMSRASGQSDAAAMELCNLARAQTLSGAFDQAQATLRDASAMAGERTPRHIKILRTLHQCQLQVYTAQNESARAGAGEALRQAREMQGENPWPGREMVSVTVFTPRRHSRTGLTAQAHGVLGWAALAEGRYEAACEALCESVALFQGLGDREYAAWALAGLGRAAWGLGERDEAQAHLLQALGTVAEIRAFIPLLHLLPVIAAALADADEPGLHERALELYALSATRPLVAKAPLFEDIAGRYVRAATASLPPEVVAAAQERGRKLDWWETAEALLDELDWQSGS
jgi:tetratricopeptide (TPR) repeat protein